MLDAHREHQRAAPSVLCHFAGRIAVTLHERHESCGGQGGILHRASLWADVGQVVAHASPAFHQLHLFFVDFDDAAVGVGLPVDAYDEAVGQRTYLEVVAYSGHRASLGDDVAEILEQGEHFVGRHRVGVFRFDAGYFPGDAAMHVVGRELINVAERILQGILACPHSSGEFIAFEICQRGFVGLVVSEFFRLHFFWVECLWRD